MLHMGLHFSAYKAEIVQVLHTDDYAKCFKFAVQMLHHLETNELFLNQILFSDKLKFHVSRRVNQHNIPFLRLVTSTCHTGNTME